MAFGINTDGSSLPSAPVGSTVTRSIPRYLDTLGSLSDGATGPFTSVDGKQMAMGANALNGYLYVSPDVPAGPLPTLGAGNRYFVAFDATSGAGDVSAPLSHYIPAAGPLPDVAIILATDDLVRLGAILWKPGADTIGLSVGGPSGGREMKMSPTTVQFGGSALAGGCFTVNAVPPDYLFQYLPQASTADIAAAAAVAAGALVFNTDNNAYQAYNGASWNQLGGSVQKLPALAIGDLPIGGGIGTSATTVDIYSMFTVAQTTPAQSITLGNPTDTTAGRFAYVSHVGSAAVLFYGKSLLPGDSAAAIWDGASWSLLSR